MSNATPTATAVSIDSGTGGQALTRKNQSLKNFAASLSTAAVIFGIQLGVFLILSGNWRLRKKSKPKETDRQSLFHRIYYYKTSYVSERKRIKEPETAIESFKNVFTIKDTELIRVAGLDGYLFLQYLQLLLKIFIPMALVILPILLPINRAGDVPGISGMDSFGWPNVGVPKKVNRLWAHLILALCVVIWVCYNFFLALRKFVRLRQTILTLPEHRIRASATTILVQSIPRKWLTVPALDALYDVFPGGIKSIWINRDYDDLQEKINKRTKIARALEAAETKLIIECAKKHKEMEAKAEKEAGIKKTKKEKKHEQKQHTQNIKQSEEDPGMTSGNPHQIEAALQEVLKEEAFSGSSSSSSSRSSSPEAQRKRRIPIPIVGEGIQAVGDGIKDVGHGVGKIGSRVVGGITGAFGRHKEDRTPPQLDGTAEEPIAASSPKESEFDTRGASTDTYTPLKSSHGGEEKAAADGLTGEPTSPQSTVKPESPTSNSEKKGALTVLKDSKINPLRQRKDFASPQPFRKEGEEFPLELPEEEKITYDYENATNEESAEDDENALWRKYLKPKDRDTMRLPLINKSWWPSIPLVGKKVDTIYYCRKELARLNYEIAEDQAHPERFKLMNSAFIQFNHQVAAHMACQSLSHHIPRQMTPRTVEVNPNYVIWDNLSIKWWERYLRTGVVVGAIIGLVICWGFPVSFTALLSQIDYLTTRFKWLKWINSLPGWLLSFIQGVLPPAFLAILFVLLPILLRFLAGFSGVTTNGEKELRVQNFYFAFVFIQLFLVVSIAAGITRTIDTLIKSPTSIPETLAQNLPGASNYFFSYMILQALSISSGALLQIGAIVMLVISRFLDTTPREKVSRVLGKANVNWGTMIPVYTNFGAIGLIYSVISPLIMLFMLLTFSLFWFTYRYQMIYVSRVAVETNGLIFPKAINQLFTGLYFMELCLIGLFFLVKNDNNDQACVPQAIIMIVALAATVGFQILLSQAFGPLLQYLPITFEDEAVRRDEEFQRAQASRWAKEDDDEHQSLNSMLSAKERREERESQMLEQEDEERRASRNYTDSTEAYELKNYQSRKSSGARLSTLGESPERSRASWADRSQSRSHSHTHHRHHDKEKHKHDIAEPFAKLTQKMRTGLDDVARPVRDLEAQTNPEAYLFTNTEDALEDIEPEQRQKLIERSFQHPATRAIQPAVWIPHDEVGITADEINRTSRYTNNIWITSKNARLDGKGNVMFRGLPPDWDPFENIEV